MKEAGRPRNGTAHSPQVQCNSGNTAALAISRLAIVGKCAVCPGNTTGID